jgi:hypothetical protein
MFLGPLFSGHTQKLTENLSQRPKKYKECSFSLFKGVFVW